MLIKLAASLKYSGISSESEFCGSFEFGPISAEFSLTTSFSGIGTELSSPVG